MPTRSVVLVGAWPLSLSGKTVEETIHPAGTYVEGIRLLICGLICTALVAPSTSSHFLSGDSVVSRRHEEANQREQISIKVPSVVSLRVCCSGWDPPNHFISINAACNRERAWPRGSESMLTGVASSDYCVCGFVPALLPWGSPSVGVAEGSDPYGGTKYLRAQMQFGE
jgi:hypothetical protein